MSTKGLYLVWRSRPSGFFRPGQEIQGVVMKGLDLASGDREVMVVTDTVIDGVRMAHRRDWCIPLDDPETRRKMKREKARIGKIEA